SEEVAVGEVDQLDDPVDERVAERDERPDRPIRDAGDERVAEADQAVRGRDQVVDRVVDRAGREHDDQPVARQEPPQSGERPEAHTAAGPYRSGFHSPLSAGNGPRTLKPDKPGPAGSFQPAG